MPKPPHFFQAYPFSCVPACIRMVLASLEFEITEVALRELCNCEDDGTTLSDAISGLKQLGYNKSTIDYLDIIELQEKLSAGFYPIVFLRLINGENHAVVVTGIFRTAIKILDPAIGEREFERQEFIKIWAVSNGKTLLIE